MAEAILRYSFDEVNVESRVGRFPFKFINAQLTSGPGLTPLGHFPKAIDFSQNARAQVDLNKLSPDFKQFCLQFTFRLDDQVKNRQNLFECTFLPFSIFVQPSDQPNQYLLNTHLHTAEHGWSGTDTAFAGRQLRNGIWYVVTLAYDLDTLALFITDRKGNPIVERIHAFPNGKLERGTRKRLYIGTWADGKRDQFQGKMANFIWYNEIPIGIENRLDERRNQAEWFMTYKYEDLKGDLNLGSKTSAAQFRAATATHIQYYEHGAILYHDSLGVAFEMHGAIFELYKRYRLKDELGYLVSDEIDTSKAGGKKSVFSKGAIVWSGRGTFVIKGEMYLSFERLGGTSFTGFPKSNPLKILEGHRQIFEGARLYYKNGAPKAHEVHGEILNRFIRSGGLNKYGFPISDEMEIKKDGVVVGKTSEFESATFYWKAGIGAFEVHGQILGRYLNELNGPLGQLGFPTSNELDIPGVEGPGRANTFENGTILWFGNERSIRVALPFKIFIHRVETREDEGVGMAQNDIYFKYAGIKKGRVWLHKKRYPQSGHFSEGNNKTVNITLPIEVVPNQLHESYTFSIKVIDMDPAGNSDDHLGTLSYELNAANAWGLREQFGSMRSSFSKVKLLTWAVRPQVDISELSEVEKWWRTRNRGTSRISKQQYAAAFRDVDSDPEWWDGADWLRRAYYHWPVKGVADGGNCFGMSTESIYARKGISLFNMPTRQYRNWNFLRQEFNIKQTYQVGAGCIFWFLANFTSGMTHNPKEVFELSRLSFEMGAHPVLCVAQNYAFVGGSCHCILPVAWDNSSKPWKITILDPNIPSKTKIMEIDPDENTYHYVGTSAYSGSQWSGGRLQFVPWPLLNSSPSTPIWDPTQLMREGFMMIIGDNTEMTEIEDGMGQDLSAHGERAKLKLKRGEETNEFFVGIPWYGRSKREDHYQLWIRREDDLERKDANAQAVANLPLADALKVAKFKSLKQQMNRSAFLRKKVAGKTALQILNNERVTQDLPNDFLQGIEELVRINSPRNFTQKIRGLEDGEFNLILKRGFNEIQILTSTKEGEEHAVQVDDFASHSNRIEFVTDRNKEVKINYRNKLGYYLG